MMHSGLIKKLHAQAAEEAAIRWMDSPINELAEYARLHRDCFAELIIKECTDIALKSGNIPNKSKEAQAEAQRIYHKIQEHFGLNDE